MLESCTSNHMPLRRLPLVAIPLVRVIMLVSAIFITSRSSPHLRLFLVTSRSHLFLLLLAQSISPAPGTSFVTSIPVLMKIGPVLLSKLPLEARRRFGQILFIENNQSELNICYLSLLSLAAPAALTTSFLQQLCHAVSMGATDLVNSS